MIIRSQKTFYHDFVYSGIGSLANRKLIWILPLIRKHQRISGEFDIA